MKEHNNYIINNNTRSVTKELTFYVKANLITDFNTYYVSLSKCKPGGRYCIIVRLAYISIPSDKYIYSDTATPMSTLTPTYSS